MTQRTIASLQVIALQAKRDKFQARLGRTMRHETALLRAKLAAALTADSPKQRAQGGDADIAALRRKLAARRRR